jgi:hypothetical protein
MLKKIMITLVLAVYCTTTPARGTYQEPADFLAEAFPDGVPEARVMWLSGERADTVKSILGHRYTSLRVRYWSREQRSAWILDEIGKDHPITVGLVINAGRLERIKVLIFRESRGWEVRHPFFTDQFSGAGLTADNRLDRGIDGISGATLSVRALKKLARLALYFHSKVVTNNDTAP